MSKINETIAVLDRSARSVGLALTERGVNRREFTIRGRLIRYRPDGKGTVRVEAFAWTDSFGRSEPGWKLDAIAHRTVEQMEALFIKTTEED